MIGDELQRFRKNDSKAVTNTIKREEKQNTPESFSTRLGPSVMGGAGVGFDGGLCAF